MIRFQLVFRRSGHRDLSEYMYSEGDGEPEIDGRLIVDGETRVIRGVEWLLRREDAGDRVPCFICTLVSAPTDS